MVATVVVYGCFTFLCAGHIMHLMLLHRRKRCKMFRDLLNFFLTAIDQLFSSIRGITVTHRQTRQSLVQVRFALIRIHGQINSPISCNGRCLSLRVSVAKKQCRFQVFVFGAFLAVPILMFMSVPLLGVSDGEESFFIIQSIMNFEAFSCQP